LPPLLSSTASGLPAVFVASGTTSPGAKLDVSGNIKLGQNSGMLCSTYTWAGTAINIASYTSGHGGSSFLVMINGHGDFEATQSALYYITVHYSGAIKSSTLISGDACTFDVSGGYLRITSGNINWGYTITVIRNDI